MSTRTRALLSKLALPPTQSRLSVELNQGREVMVKVCGNSLALQPG